MTLALTTPKIDQPVNMVDPVNRLHPLNRGLVSWWLALPGLMGGSRFIDLVNPGAHGNHGTLTNMDPVTDWRGTTRPGGYGELHFDGTNDHVPIPKSQSFSWDGLTELTVACWALWDRGGSSSEEDCMIGAWGASSDWQILFRFDSNISACEFYLGNHPSYTIGTFAGTDMSGAAWHHMVGVWDGATMYMWMDGVKSATTASWSTVIGTSTQDTAIAADNFIGSPRDHWHGPMDDVRIWKRGITDAEVLWLYQESKDYNPGTLNRVRRSVPFAEVVGGVTMPIFDHHYRMSRGA